MKPPGRGGWRARRDSNPDLLSEVSCSDPLSYGLPAMRFHDLRHGAASLLLSQGVHPRVVMELLGHSTIMLTMNTYSHVIPDFQREAAEKVETALG